MSLIAKQKLVELVARFGRDICDDPRRCEALLRDVCGDQHQREVFVLVAAVKNRAASELAADVSSVPAEVLLGRLSDRLHKSLGIREDLARWSVESWALALGVLTSPTENPSSDQQPAFSPKQQRAITSPRKARGVSRASPQIPAPGGQSPSPAKQQRRRTSQRKARDVSQANPETPEFGEQLATAAKLNEAGISSLPAVSVWEGEPQAPASVEQAAPEKSITARAHPAFQAFVFFGSLSIITATVWRYYLHAGVSWSLGLWVIGQLVFASFMGLVQSRNCSTRVSSLISGLLTPVPGLLASILAPTSFWEYWWVHALVAPAVWLFGFIKAAYVLGNQFKCPCGHCGQKLSFPRWMLNTTIECPACKKETILKQAP